MRVSKVCQATRPRCRSEAYPFLCQDYCYYRVLAEHGNAQAYPEAIEATHADFVPLASQGRPA